MGKKKWASTENNVVILHQFSPGRFTPCTSPFALKLETYLRMAKISYQVMVYLLNIWMSALYLIVMIVSFYNTE